jgi:heptosyltransferase II
LKLNVVALFTCTSQAEIYDYGRMVKVISPLLEKAFYRREYIQEAADAVSIDSVYRAVKSSAGGSTD